MQSSPPPCGVPRLQMPDPSLQPSVGVPEGGPCPPPFFAGQLTLFQSGGADYAHDITTRPPDFQTFLRPCSVGGAGPLFDYEK